jgi:hypothetical protein
MKANMEHLWNDTRKGKRADNLTTFMCRLSRNLGASTSWNPVGLSRPVMGLLYLYHQGIQQFEKIHKAEHIVDGIENYHKNLLQHVKRMEHARIPTKNQTRHRPTKNKMDRPTGSSIFSFHKTEHRVLRLLIFMMMMMMMTMYFSTANCTIIHKVLNTGVSP